MGKSIGEILTQRRKQLNITQSVLADIANVSINTVYKIERNEGNPTLEVLKRIGLILGLEVSLNVLEVNSN